MRCGRGLTPDAGGGAEAREASSGQAIVDREVGSDGESRPSLTRSIVSLLEGLTVSGSERSGLYTSLSAVFSPSFGLLL